MRIQISLLSIALLLGCQKSDETGDYYLDIVCKIYTEVHASESSISMKEGDVYELIQGALPEFEQENYRHIATMDPDQRYPTFKKLAELDGNPDWQCAAIQEYMEAIYESGE